jgi:hypothetical protein
MVKSALKSLSFVPAGIMAGNLTGEAGVITGIPETVMAALVSPGEVSHSKATATGTNKRATTVVKTTFSQLRPHLRGDRVLSDPANGKAHVRGRVS